MTTMSELVDIPRLTRILLREASSRANTDAASDQPILGGPLDGRHKNLAYLIKLQNLELRLSNSGVLQEWLGTKPIVPPIFNFNSTLKTDCITRIIGAAATDVSSRHSAHLSKFEDCTDDYAIWTLFNRKFPQQQKTFPLKAWKDDGIIFAGLHPDPPLHLRTNPLPAFHRPDFDYQDPATWHSLSSSDFERALCLYGFYPQHLVSRGFVFDATLLIAQAPNKDSLTVSQASPHAQVIQIAQDLNVLSFSQATTEKKCAQHWLDTKAQHEAFLLLKRFLATAFGQDFQDELSPFSLTNNFNGARIHLATTYGKLENSTSVLDHVRGALNSMQTYSNCTSVQGVINTWETTLSLVIFLSHIHLNTPLPSRPSSSADILSSLYLSDVDFSSTFPTTSRIIRYEDALGYFLHPFQSSSMSSLVIRWISEDAQLSILNMKAILLKVEQLEKLAPPFLSLSLSSPSFPSSIKSFGVHIDPSIHKDLIEDNRLYALQVSGTSQPTPSLLSPHPALPSSSSSSISALTANRSIPSPSLHPFDTSVFSRLPCILCVNGGSAHHQEKAAASSHSLVACPILPHIAHLSKNELNHQKWPSAHQVGAGFNWNLAMRHHRSLFLSSISLSFSKRPYSQSSSPSPSPRARRPTPPTSLSSTLPRK